LKSVKIDGKIILCIQVPASSEVHTFKKVIYDRVFESDVKVTATAQIAEMYIRKQNVFILGIMTLAVIYFSCGLFFLVVK